MNFLSLLGGSKSSLLKITSASLGVVLALTLTTLYYYHKTSQRALETLREHVVILEQANVKNIKTIEQLRADYSKYVQLSKELEEENRKARRDVNELREKFIDHDLTKLSIAKPKLIEKRINDGTQKVFNDIRNDTRD